MFCTPVPCQLSAHVFCQLLSACGYVFESFFSSKAAPLILPLQGVFPTPETATVGFSYSFASSFIAMPLLTPGLGRLWEGCQAGMDLTWTWAGTELHKGFPPALTLSCSLPPIFSEPGGHINFLYPTL